MEMWKCHTTTKQLPIPDEDSLVFWEGCRRQRLLLQQCEACHRFRFPPSPLCPHCLSPLAIWQRDPGDGEILTFCVYHAELAGPAWRAEVPYTVAVVRLWYSAVKMLSRVLHVNPAEVRIGQPVRVVFPAAGNDFRLPCFVPR